MRSSRSSRRIPIARDRCFSIFYECSTSPRRWASWRPMPLRLVRARGESFKNTREIYECAGASDMFHLE